MSWKKSFAWFAWQSIKYAQNFAHFKKNWSYRSAWAASFCAGRNSVADEMAWLNFEAIQFLESEIKPDFKIFEYGGGGSTLFFGKKAAFVATVENDGGWFQNLTKIIENKGWKHWKGFFIEGETVPANEKRSIQNPADFKSNAPGQANLSYEKYAKAIHEFPDEHFDIVLVDGRARPSCIAESFRHLKKGGLLIVDNMERQYYHDAFPESFWRQFEVVVSGRFPVPYHPDFTVTKILRKKG